MKYLVVVLSLLVSTSAFAEYISPDTELDRIFGKDTIKDRDLPEQRWDITDHTLKVQLPGGYKLSIEVDKLDRNSTFKVWDETHGRNRIHIPNCDGTPQQYNNDLITGSFDVQFINHKNRAFAIRSNGSSGATYASVDTYKVSITDFGVEVCKFSALVSEFQQNEITGEYLQTPWKYAK